MSAFADAFVIALDLPRWSAGSGLETNWLAVMCPNHGDRERNAGEAELAEKLDRPVGSAVEKVDDQRIEQHQGDAANPVFRTAEAARVMRDEQ